MSGEGGCACGDIRFRLTDTPLIVQACHCHDCQRLTGSAFGVNAWIEASAVERISGEPVSFQATGGSGKPHDVCFCGRCGTTVWSRYHAAPKGTLFVRVGALDRPEDLSPDVHIFTASKQPWLDLPEGARTFEAFYDLREVWPADRLARLRACMAAGR